MFNKCYQIINLLFVINEFLSRFENPNVWNNYFAIAGVGDGGLLKAETKVLRQNYNIDTAIELWEHNGKSLYAFRGSTKHHSCRSTFTLMLARIGPTLPSTDPLNAFGTFRVEHILHPYTRHARQHFRGS